MSGENGLDAAMGRIESGEFRTEDPQLVVQRCRAYRERMAAWCTDSLQQVRELHDIRKNFADVCTRYAAIVQQREQLELQVQELSAKNAALQRELDYARFLLHSLEMEQGRSAEHVRR